MLICRAGSRMAKTQIKPILQTVKQLELKAVIKSFMYTSGEKERIPAINSHYVS